MNLADILSQNTDGAPGKVVLRQLLICAMHWEPQARIIGNIQSEDIQKACIEAIEALEEKENGNNNR